jgi:hypothetical protein
MPSLGRLWSWYRVNFGSATPGPFDRTGLNRFSFFLSSKRAGQRSKAGLESVLFEG